MSDAVAVTASASEMTRDARKLQRYKEEAARRKDQVDKLTKERDELLQQVTAVTKERDDFKVKAEGGPQELQSRVQELEGQILQRDTDDAFKSLYEDKELGLDKRIPPAKLQSLLGYKPEGAPDAAKIKELVAAQKQGELSFIFAAEDPGPPPAKPPGPGVVAAREPGLGAGRSAPSHTPPGDELAKLSQYHAAMGRKHPGQI